MTCDRCQKPLAIGEYPFCPHGFTHLAVQPDELIGGFVQENFGDEPEYFTSKKAMLQRADELGLRQVDNGDRRKGKFTVTAKTLEDAKVLLSRGALKVDETPCESAEFTMREVTLR